MSTNAKNPKILVTSAGKIFWKIRYFSTIKIKELLKHTPIESPDRKSLDLAKEAMDDINSYINEMKRDHEMMQFIDEVEKSISDLTMVWKYFF